MDSLKQKLASRVAKQSTKRISERGALIKQFLDRLNPPRVAAGFREISPARLGMLLQFMTTKQLYAFYAELKQAKNFSKSFWWRIKGKDLEQ